MQEQQTAETKLEGFFYLSGISEISASLYIDMSLHV